MSDFVFFFFSPANNPAVYLSYNSKRNSMRFVLLGKGKGTAFNFIPAQGHILALLETQYKTSKGVCLTKCCEQMNLHHLAPTKE